MFTVRSNTTLFLLPCLIKTGEIFFYAKESKKEMGMSKRPIPKKPRGDETGRKEDE